MTMQCCKTSIANASDEKKKGPIYSHLGPTTAIEIKKKALSLHKTSKKKKKN